MKKIFLFLIAGTVIFLAACSNNSEQKKTATFNPADLLNDTTKTENFTTIKWLDSVVNFGTVVKGTQVKVVFRFMNSGTRPLYIIYAKPGCGCTIADFTKGAIMPGKQGEVTGQYDSNHGTPGEEVRKSIFITCNALNATRYNLMFTGMVRDSTK